MTEGGWLGWIDVTFGTHNLHDAESPATPFADVICFTEAIPDKVRAQLARTHEVYICRWQRDLVIAVARHLDFHDVKPHYRLVHPGVPLVTPHRGIFWLTGKVGIVDLLLAALDEHRINAAHPPFRRGEKWFRRRMWKRHTRRTNKIIRRLIRRGYVVLAGGDTNTPNGVSAYDTTMIETGRGYDRIAVSSRSARWTTAADYLPGGEAIHPRLRRGVRLGRNH
jgi:hypothetical protein